MISAAHVASPHPWQSVTSVQPLQALPLSHEPSLAKLQLSSCAAAVGADHQRDQRRAPQSAAASWSRSASVAAAGSQAEIGRLGRAAASGPRALAYARGHHLWGTALGFCAFGRFHLHKSHYDYDLLDQGLYFSPVYLDRSPPSIVYYS